MGIFLARLIKQVNRHPQIQSYCACNFAFKTIIRTSSIVIFHQLDGGDGRIGSADVYTSTGAVTHVVMTLLVVDAVSRRQL